MNETIEIDKVGAINHLSIPLPEGGGLVVLKGRNGAGKSTAIKSVESLYDPIARKSLETSDRSIDPGTIHGKGVRVKLGKSKSTIGELVCDSIDGGLDPSVFVDPGIKDEVKADAKRLHVLVRLSGLKILKSDWMSLTGGKYEDLVQADPIETADRIRRAIHTEAKMLEEQIEKRSREADALIRPAMDQDLSLAEKADTFADLLDQLRKDLFSAAIENKNAIEQNAKVTEAKLKLDGIARPVPVSEVESELESHNRGILILESEMEDLGRELKRKEIDLQEMKFRKEQFETQLENSRRLQKLIDDLESSAALEIQPTIEVSDIEARIAKGTRLHEQALLAKKVRDDLIKGDAIKAELEKEKTEAKKLREVARGTDSIFGRQLSSMGFTDVIVDDGRLKVKSDRGLELVSELSDGERWRLAIKVAANGLGEGAILPVEQAAYEGLDPENRLLIRDLARKKKIVIVTALASDEELTAEVVQ